MEGEKELGGRAKILLETAQHIAKEVKAKGLFIYAHALEDLQLIKTIPNDIEITLITKDETNVKDIDGIRTILRIPPIDFTRMGQIKIGLIMALAQGIFSVGETIVYLGGISSVDTIMVLEIGKEYEMIASMATSPVFGKVYPEVFEKTLDIAIDLAHQGREGKPIGAIFVLGDHERVLQHSRQRVMNPFEGHPEERRNILDPKLGETIKEFSFIDGAFILREDGLILAAGRHLNAVYEGEKLPQGLGSRHVAAAAITAVTHAMAITVSQSTGNITVFGEGRILIEIEKSISQGLGKDLDPSLPKRDAWLV